MAFINGTYQDDVLKGTDQADTIRGRSGNDTLAGGAGNDYLVGGLGNDTYIFNLGDGIDTIDNYDPTAGRLDTLKLGTGLTSENLLVTRSTTAPNDLVLSFNGNTADKIVLRDFFLGSAFQLNQIQFANGQSLSAKDLFTQFIAQIPTKNTQTATATTPNLTGTDESDRLIGDDGANILLGKGGDDVLIGGGGSDVLDGGTGADVMMGGTGDDNYRVDNAGDMVIENANEGVDTVTTTLSNYALTANVENLVIESAAGKYGTYAGNELNNTITAGLGNDWIDGGDGVDTLSFSTFKKAATDTSTQGVNVSLDAYWRQNTGAGWDVIRGIENLEGTQYDDRLTGDWGNNTLTGGAGNDRLDGGWGADTLYGGSGNDTYVVDNAGDVVSELTLDPATGAPAANAVDAGGIDTVESYINYTLGQNIENLTLLGWAANGTGNALNNTLIGNWMNNVLDGKAGADIMKGGWGNDTYVVDNAGDQVIELAGQGIDTVKLAFNPATYTLGDNVENLELTDPAGSTAVTGNALNNTFYGLTTAVAPTTPELSGADKFDGAAGIDTANYEKAVSAVYGVLADTTLAVGAARHDTLTNIENLVGSAYNDTLQGNAQANDLNGGAGDDTLLGDAGDDTLWGGEGNDILDGGKGNDSLNGGAGNDTYLIARDSNADTIQDRDYTAGNQDRIQYAADIKQDQLWFSRSANNLVIQVIGTDVKTTIRNWYLGSQNQIETITVGGPQASYQLSNANVQKLVSAMSGLTPPAAGQSSLTTDQHQKLDTVINGAWVAAATPN